MFQYIRNVAFFDRTTDTRIWLPAHTILAQTVFLTLIYTLTRNRTLKIDPSYDYVNIEGKDTLLCKHTKCKISVAYLFAVYLTSFYQ
jgi:hypothetical protein